MPPCKRDRCTFCGLELPGLPNRWQHLARHPMLEALGFRLVAAHDQRVQAGFVDDSSHLRATHTVDDRGFSSIALFDVPI